MRICIFTDSFLPYCSGVTFAVINQARELANRGHEVSIFRPRPRHIAAGENSELPDSVKVYDIPLAVSVPSIPNLRVVLPSVASSLTKMRRIRPEVVHVSSEWGCGWEGVAASRLLGVPVVGTFHTFFADPGYLKCFGLPNWKSIRRCMWRYSIFFYNRCRAVISPSQAVKQALMTHGLRREPLVISNGIRQPKLQAASCVAEMRAGHNLPGPSFIYVGRISPEKSLDVLLKAFQRITSQHHPEARLFIVGDGPYRAEMNHLIQQLQIQDQVIQLGHVPHDRLIADNVPLLGDVFITASTTENQPLSILEAMAFGLPVVGPRAKGIPELVVEGENGFLFPPNNEEAMATCMRRLLDDRPLRERMARCSKEHATEHTIGRVVDKLEQVYQDATGPDSRDLDDSPDRQRRVA